ncbi:MAG: ABC transporter permease [Actinomycetota bacterium]|nr:ABC transporter permease [Actinomycetota bacterium]MDA3001797.1 ABC transporter permease [Actinomycetota bacterium]
MSNDNTSLRVERRVPRQADRDPAGFLRKRRIIEVSLAIAFPVLLLLLWQVAGSREWIDRRFYPPPSDIIGEIQRTFQDNPKGNWWVHIWVSVKRMLWGYGWGVIAGLALGVGMGMSRKLRATLEPTLNALYTVPKLALIGIFLIVLGFDDKPLIAVIAVTVFFFVWMQSMHAVMSVPEQLRETARSFESGRVQLFRHVIFPAALPEIFLGLRVSAGVAVLTLIGAEFVYAPGLEGIGYRINNARTVFDPLQAYVGLFVAAILGAIFVSVIKVIGKLVAPWASDDRTVL